MNASPGKIKAKGDASDKLSQDAEGAVRQSERVLNYRETTNGLTETLILKMFHVDVGRGICTQIFTQIKM